MLVPFLFFVLVFSRINQAITLTQFRIFETGYCFAFTWIQFLGYLAHFHWVETVLINCCTALSHYKTPPLQNNCFKPHIRS